MADTAQIHAVHRGGATDGVPNGIQMNTQREVFVAQGLPPYTEMARRGGFSVMNTTALAALVVRPSTVANLTLFNNEAAGGKSYVIDRLFAFNLVSTAAQARHGLWACVHKPMAKPTADITAIASSSGKNYGGLAVVDTGATVADDGWFPWGPWGDVEPTGVLPGGILTVNVEGRLIVPPGCGISTQVVSSVVGNTYTTGFSWYEVVIPTE